MQKTKKQAKSHRKAKLKPKSIKKHLQTKHKGGGQKVEKTIEFWNNLGTSTQAIILAPRQPVTDLSIIITKYTQIQLYQLYDFIFPLGLTTLTTPMVIWDHGKNDPNSITAGLPGVHIYAIIKNGKYEVLDRFIRN
jgi:hypothetical protein